MKQFVITPAAGKRLIAKAAAQLTAVTGALNAGTVVIIAGTTNAYVAEEILKKIKQKFPYDKKQFIRGITIPPSKPTTKHGRLTDSKKFPGDIIIEKGKCRTGKTIFDVVDKLNHHDVIIKGANALDIRNRQAGVLIGHPKGGTIIAALQAVTGRKTRLIIPVGLEKRVNTNLNTIAKMLNAPGTEGPSLLPLPGPILTEIDALKILTGADAFLTAAGGVAGAEGAVWLAIDGNPQQLKNAQKILKNISTEPPFNI